MDDKRLAEIVSQHVGLAIDAQTLRKLVAVLPILDVRRRWGVGLLTDSEAAAQLSAAEQQTANNMIRLEKAENKTPDKTPKEMIK